VWPCTAPNLHAILSENLGGALATTVRLKPDAEPLLRSSKRSLALVYFLSSDDRLTGNPSADLCEAGRMAAK
jgi:hypothetical protein